MRVVRKIPDNINATGCAKRAKHGQTVHNITNIQRMVAFITTSGQRFL